MGDKGIIMPWDVGGLEQVLTDHRTEEYISREDFVSQFLSHDFLYGRGASSSQIVNGYHTVQGGISLNQDDPRSVLVFAIPPANKIIINGLFQDRIGIGRAYDPNVQIVIPDPSISKLHAYLKRISGGLLLIDVDSKYGTQVNDRSIKPNPPGEIIKPGDKIKFGRANLIFEYMIASQCYETVRQDIRAHHGKGSNT